MKANLNKALRIGFEGSFIGNFESGMGNYTRTLLKQTKTFFPVHELHVFEGEKDLINRKWVKSVMPDINWYSYVQAKKNYWKSHGLEKNWASKNIDIYHSLSGFIPFDTDKVDVPIVVTIPDLTFKKHKEYFGITERVAINLKIENSLEEADKIIAISNHTKQDLIKYYNIDEHKIDIIYPSADNYFYKNIDKTLSKEFLKKSNLPQDYLLYSGSISEKKEIKTILKAIKKMPKNRRLPLVIVGKGEYYKSKLKSFIEKNDLSKYCIFFELEERNNFPYLYNNAKILIQPSVYEGFAMNVLEAILSETRVIAADNSSMKEVGGPFSTYFESKNVNDLAEKIDLVLSDSSDTEEQTQKSKIWATHQFSQNKSAAKITKLYESLI